MGDGFTIKAMLGLFALGIKTRTAVTLDWKEQIALSQEIDAMQATIEAADNVIHQVTAMAIDGWFEGEYNLPDQQKVMSAVRNYLKVRYPNSG